MIPRKPIWTEGLFITQHHLQQQDKYHEALVAERFEARLMYAWGIRQLEIDTRALSGGQFRLSQVSAILPDGTPVSFGEGVAEPPPPRPVDAAFPAHMQTLPVYLAVPHEAEHSANVVLSGGVGDAMRYLSATGRVADQNSGTAEQDITWARPNARILLGEERRDSYDAVQVADLVRTNTGQVTLRDTYIPPILRIGASPFLCAGVRRVLAAMTARQRSLAASRRQRSESQIDFQASDAAKFWLLNTLNEMIPVIAHLADHEDSHPERAYLALAQLIGKLSTFAVDSDPTTIPKFNYLNLGDVFEPIFARSISLLNSVIAERYVEIPLEKRPDGMYLGKVTDSTVLRYSFFVAASGTLAEVELRDRLPRLTKIASWNQIGPLLNSAVNGVRIELEYRPPGALPVRPGMVFFRVEKTAEYWPDIQGTGTVALYHPLPQESVKLSLYAVDPQNL